MKDRSWKPVRRGALYCAPACGRGCTWREYNTARKKAAALAKRLGPRWTSRVWENLGWHYAAVSPCGRGQVHGHGDGYWAGFHFGAHQIHATREHPVAAVRAVLRAGHALANELIRGVSEVSAELSP